MGDNIRVTKEQETEKNDNIDAKQIQKPSPRPFPRRSPVSTWGFLLESFLNPISNRHYTPLLTSPSSISPSFSSATDSSLQSSSVFSSPITYGNIHGVVIALHLKAQLKTLNIYPDENFYHAALEALAKHGNFLAENQDPTKNRFDPLNLHDLKLIHLFSEKQIETKKEIELMEAIEQGYAEAYKTMLVKNSAKNKNNNHNMIKDEEKERKKESSTISSSMDQMLQAVREKCIKEKSMSPIAQTIITRLKKPREVANIAIEIYQEMITRGYSPHSKTYSNLFVYK